MLRYMPQMPILNYDSSPSNLPKQEKTPPPLSTQGISHRPPKESICKASSSMSSAIRAIILIPPLRSHLSPLRTHFDHFGAINT